MISKKADLITILILLLISIVTSFNFIWICIVSGILAMALFVVAIWKWT